MSAYPLIKVFVPRYPYDLDARKEFDRTRETLMFFYEEQFEIEYLVYSNVLDPMDLTDQLLTCIVYKYNTEIILAEYTNEEITDEEGESYDPPVYNGIEVLNAQEGYFKINPSITSEETSLLTIGDHHYIIYAQKDQRTKVIDRNYLSIKAKCIGPYTV